MCIYNIDRMKAQSEMFERAGIVTVCIFKSTPQNIARYSMASVGDCSLALSDVKGRVFKAYMLKKSTKAAIKGMRGMIANYGSLKEFISIPAMMRDTKGMTSIDKIRQLPADFLIDEKGIIVDLFRGERGSDHMPFDRVEAFIPEEFRCKCNKKDCIVPRCRENYADIRRDAMQMIFDGSE